jgi:hypothetical protein
MTATTPATPPTPDPPKAPAKAGPGAPSAATEAPAATPEPEKISTGYSLPTDLHTALREAAKARGVSASYLVQKAVEDYLPRLIPVEELTLVRPVGS